MQALGNDGDCSIAGKSGEGKKKANSSLFEDQLLFAFWAMEGTVVFVRFHR